MGLSFKIISMSSSISVPSFMLLPQNPQFCHYFTPFCWTICLIFFPRPYAFAGPSKTISAICNHLRQRSVLWRKRSVENAERCHAFLSRQWLPGVSFCSRNSSADHVSNKVIFSCEIPVFQMWEIHWHKKRKLKYFVKKRNISCKKSLLMRTKISPVLCEKNVSVKKSWTQFNFFRISLAK